MTAGPLYHLTLSMHFDRQRASGGDPLLKTMVLAVGAAGAEGVAGLVHWTGTAYDHRTWTGHVRQIGHRRARRIWLDLLHWLELVLVRSALPPAHRFEFCELDRPPGQSARVSDSYRALSTGRSSSATGYGCLPGPGTRRNCPASSPEPGLRSSRPLPGA